MRLCAQEKSHKNKKTDATQIILPSNIRYNAAKLLSYSAVLLG